MCDKERKTDSIPSGPMTPGREGRGEGRHEAEMRATRSVTVRENLQNLMQHHCNEVARLHRLLHSLPPGVGNMPLEQARESINIYF